MFKIDHRSVQIFTVYESLSPLEPLQSEALVFWSSTSQTITQVTPATPTFTPCKLVCGSAGQAPYNLHLKRLIGIYNTQHYQQWVSAVLGSHKSSSQSWAHSILDLNSLRMDTGLQQQS